MIVKEETKEVQEETHFKKTYMLLTIILINIFLIALTWLCSFPINAYELENYRNVLNSLFQINGSIFAFIASSTLVVLQINNSKSPNMIKFYPMGVFITFMSVTIAFLIFDGIVLLYLRETISLFNQFCLNWLIVSNIYPIILAFALIFYVVRCMNPKYQVKQLISSARQAKNNDDRRDIIYAIEEMFLHAIQCGQGGTIRLLQNTISKVIAIYTETKQHLNKNCKYEPEHPLRIVPDIIERISFGLLDNDMSNLFHFNGHILRELSGSKCENDSIAGVEITISTKNILDKCLEKNCVSDLTNFCANFIMCADEDDDLDTILWSVESMLECLSKNTKSSDDTNEIFSSIITYLIYLCKDMTAREAFKRRRMKDVLKRQCVLWDNCQRCHNKRTMELFEELIVLTEE